MRCSPNRPERKRKLVWWPWVLDRSGGRGDMVTLLQSTQVHIPLLGQCCLFNRSASCLWLLSFLLNITGQIPSSHPPSLPTPTSLSFPAVSSHKELLLTFLKCLNCERLFNKLKPSVPCERGESIAGCKLGVQGRRSPRLCCYRIRGSLDQEEAQRACQSPLLVNVSGFK